MKPIHNLLRQRLYRTQKPLLEHPPIGLLGAFAEKALSGPDSSLIFEHLAQCTDCREIVFLSAPEANTIPTPGHVLPGRRISWPVLRWGSAAACAVIVVGAMRMHTSYPVGQPEPAATQPSQQSTLAGNRTNAVGTGRGPAMVPTPRKTHGQPGKAKDVPETLRAQASPSLQAAFVPRPGNLPPRWTLTSAGTLQRSLDGGITWQQIEVSRDRVFRAVAAAGSSVWLGGQRGVLFHSPDAGGHWTQVGPRTKLPASDIIGIQFEDDQHGKLTTATNESWTTSDAGSSWQKQ